jgi:hypothetical protein
MKIPCACQPSINNPPPNRGPATVPTRPNPNAQPAPVEFFSQPMRTVWPIGETGRHDHVRRRQVSLRGLQTPHIILPPHTLHVHAKAGA